MNEFIKQNWFKIIIAVAVIVVVISIGYYFIVFLPNKNEEQKILKEDTQQSLNNCLDNTVDYYNNQIDDYCKSYTVKEDCKIPQSTVNIWLGNQKLLRSECFKKYPQN